MMTKGILQGAVLVVAFALVVTACGGGNHRVAPPVRAADSLTDALAELDAMEPPEGVNAALFVELKDALRDALLTTSDGRLTTAKLVSTPPTGEVNRVTDLVLTEAGGGTYNLALRYRNSGD